MSPDHRLHEPVPTPLKVVVVGGAGVGTTTFVRAVSEFAPPSTDRYVTVAPVGDLPAGRATATTTAALEVARVGVGDSHVLYLLGMPAQGRSSMWDELARGAVGAVVLVDPLRIEISFAAVDFVESRDIPFVVAVNGFPGADRFRPADVHDALGLRGDVPVLPTDARVRGSCLATVIRLVEHALDRSVVVRFPPVAR
ncbi:GTP-binding protein [Pseudonocardia adelaidensis]|uniref:ATP/GTP-binding protein n=1 Tax=Pseudonocardia adelaidensis TaxID=648754 RepID=A0ABP9NET9_9PSEU